MFEGQDYSGISLFASVPVAEKVKLFARWDRIMSVTMEGAEDPWNNRDGSYIFTGIDISPVKNVRISPNFTGYLPAGSGSDNISTIGLNIMAKF